MSDRAATESKFNSLLQSYSESCLPKIQENWQLLSKTAKQKLIEMNNFFCGRHLLVSMAETISESFKKFENLHLEGQKAGAAATQGITVMGSDSGTIRLVRSSCKALARGADDKNGCFRSWNTYLNNANVTKRFSILQYLRFRNTNKVKFKV